MKEVFKARICETDTEVFIYLIILKQNAFVTTSTFETIELMGAKFKNQATKYIGQMTFLRASLVKRNIFCLTIFQGFTILCSFLLSIFFSNFFFFF